MIIYANSRRSGKSTEAIMLASSTHSVLIVPTKECVRFAERIAREINYPILIMSARDYFKNNNERPRISIKRVVVDDLEWCLSEVFGCEVLMATTHGFVNDFKILPPTKLEYKQR